ncbi:MAG: nuclear transport factor 2 family protein [Oligoflexales bacterium]
MDHSMAGERVNTDLTREVVKVLDQFHGAAAKADGATYFGLFAPQGVFIGTDPGERWTVEEFKKYAEPHFAKGQGWTYVAKTRHVDISPSKDVAWFDELLDNKSYGVCRGTGVLLKLNGAWKISQYHLTIPIPNELALDTVKAIRGQK